MMIDFTEIIQNGVSFTEVMQNGVSLWKLSGYWVFFKQLCNSLTDTVGVYYGNLSNRSVSGLKYRKTGSSSYSRIYVAKNKLITGHKYYVSFTTEVGGELGSNVLRIYLGMNSGSYMRMIYDGSFGDGSLQHISTMGDFAEIRDTENQVYIQLNIAQNGYVDVGNIMVFDLTEMFGSGYEPTSAEEFERYYPNNFYNPDDGKWMPAPPGVVTAYTKPSFD